MGISRSTYYEKSRLQSGKQLRSDLELKAMIEQVQAKFPGYGYRRLKHHFLREGLCINSKRIRRVAKRYALFSSVKPIFTKRGEKTGMRLIFPNRIRGKKVKRPNQVWATDLTCVKLLNEYMYLSAIIDVYTRKIVGWSIAKEMTHELCLRSLKVAIRNYAPAKGIIHHSDRGTQYVCQNYVQYLEDNGFLVSMSRPATPVDNAYIETFFKTLKREEIYVRNYETLSDVKKHLPKFIDEIYNEKRLHSSLGYRSPAEYEAAILKMKPAKRPVQKIWGRAV